MHIQIYNEHLYHISTNPWKRNVTMTLFRTLESSQDDGVTLPKRSHGGFYSRAIQDLPKAHARYTPMIFPLVVKSLATFSTSHHNLITAMYVIL